MFVRAGLITAIGVIALSNPCLAQELGKPDREMAEKVKQEQQSHVGEVLPAGIQVRLDDGRTVDLREQLHGPAIVIQSYSFTVLPELLQAVRESNGKSPDATNADIALILVSDKEYQRPDVPDSISVFHRSISENTGFIGARLMPTIFYFDKDLKLIERQVGMRGDIRSFLNFPTE